MCYEMNSILSKFGYFFWVFELKNKFRHLAVKDRRQQKIVRQLSSCLMEKYNGFTIASIEYQKKKKEKNLNGSTSFISQPKILKLNLFVTFQKMFQKHILLYILKGRKKAWVEHIRFINLIIAINFLLTRRVKKDIKEITQKNQE